MAFNNSAGRNNAMAPMPPQSAPPRAGDPGTSWEEMGSQRFQPKGRRRYILPLLSTILILMLVFAGVRLGVTLSGTNDQIQVLVGDQQSAIVDLRQSMPISPQLRGANVFPQDNSQDVDGSYSADIMKYTTKMATDMQTMKLGLLRFPGGSVGETNIVSYDQLDQFAKMLNDTHAEGMVQAHLGGPTAHGNPHNLTDDVATRASLAGSWVAFMNNSKSDVRPANLKDFHPVKYWSVGDEPDKQINPLTKKPYLVSEYVDAFIQFSIAMHKSDPNIMVFGPEISNFQGIGVGPSDANGQKWMESFLKGVAAYESAHQADIKSISTSGHLLDGVSFHYYPLQGQANVNPSQLMSDPDSWAYTIPQLHDTIKQIMGHDLPISVSEVNTNASGKAPTQGEAALWWADTLGELMNENVGYVSFFGASGVEAGIPLFSADGLHDTAMERVMETFANLQSNLVPMGIQRDPISVYATQNSTHQIVSLLFVNKSNTPQSAQINPVNNFLGLSPWHSVNISVGANSVIVLTLYRDGRAPIANYFQVSAQNDNQVNSVNQAICGKKADVLDTNVPC
ncbi:MAG TPA: glycoside hydrolase family 44 protein [Ktedonobacteraceae bacterium]|nr:glycoside hydrolase family 44 protein [Ktedonobacteraceae bacterium]